MSLGKGIWAATLAVAALLVAATSAYGDADISVSVTASKASLPLGGPDNTEMTLTAANAGPDTAAGVSGAVTIGTPQLAFVGFTSITQGSAIHNGSSNPPLTFNFGDIPSGGSASLKWVENDAQTGLGTVTATATTSTAESSTANNAASVGVEVLGLVPSASSLSFGSQTIGGIGSATPLTVTNKAGIPILVSSVALGGDDFVTSADGCAGKTLAVGESCQTSSRFAPSALGDRSGTLTVSSSTAGVSPVVVGLAGTGTAAPSPDVTAASIGLAGVPKSISAKAFRKGFSVRVTPNEAASLDVELLGTARSGALASAFDLRLFRRALPIASGTRSIRVKPKGKLLGRLSRKIKVQLVVTATDASGNRATATRRLTVKPPAGR